MYPKTYVIDTSVYLTDHTSINNFGRSDIIVPLKVLEEIDKHKKRQDSVGNNARGIVRTFDSLRENGSLQDGVSLGDKRGNLYVKGYDSSYIPDDLDRKNADHIIIATALTLRAQEPERCNFSHQRHPTKGNLRLTRTCLRRVQFRSGC